MIAKNDMKKENIDRIGFIILLRVSAVWCPGVKLNNNHKTEVGKRQNKNCICIWLCGNIQFGYICLRYDNVPNRFLFDGHW